MGGSFSNLLFNVCRRHPLDASRRLIDWDLILIMEPSTILGAVGGSYINHLLPSWATVRCSYPSARHAVQGRARNHLRASVCM